MKAKDLRKFDTEDLKARKASLTKELFGHRMKNFTNQLENTSLISSARKDLARIELILHERGGPETSQAAIESKGNEQ